MLVERYIDIHLIVHKVHLNDIDEFIFFELITFALLTMDEDSIHIITISRHAKIF